MRIIHTADLHLDSRLETNLDPVKAKERKRELLLSFDNLINYAKNNQVEAILISGDLFDRPKISAKTREYILGLIEDAKEIAETLISHQTVILNMEGVDVGLAQRIIDFSSGACYALNGNLQKISNFIFIITPHSIGISGDLQEIVNAFDFSGIQTGF